jgi:hypothetical protein
MDLVRMRGYLLGVAGAAMLGLMLTSSAFAAANTKGLASISVQGVGTGSLALGDCAAIPCSTTGACMCLSGAQSLVGNQGFKGGSLTYTLSVESSITVLPVSTTPGACWPATGNATVANKNGKNTITMDLTGLACTTQNTAVDVFNGTYTVTGGSGKYSSTSTGTGALNGDQTNTGTGTPAHAALTGSIQP